MRRRCSAALSTEGVQHVEPDLLDDVEGVLEIPPGLRGETHHYVRAEGNVRPRLAEAGHQIQVGCLRVVPVHGLQHRVRARLERQVDVAAELRKVPEAGHELSARVLGVGGGEPHALMPPISWILSKAPERTCRPVGIDVLAEEKTSFTRCPRACAPLRSPAVRPC